MSSNPHHIILATLPTDQFEYLLDLPEGVSVQRVSVESGEIRLALSVSGGVADTWPDSVLLQYTADAEGHLLLVGTEDAVSS